MPLGFILLQYKLDVFIQSLIDCPKPFGHILMYGCNKSERYKQSDLVKTNLHNSILTDLNLLKDRL